MKKILFIILAVALFYGCSKKDSGSKSATTIVGKWYFYKDTVTEYNGATVASQIINGINTGSWVQFNANGNGSEHDPGNATDTTTLSANFTYAVSGNNLTLNYPQTTIDGTVQAPYSQSATIHSVTSSNLVIYFDQSFTSNGITFRQVERDYLNK
jgi:hypothetical protein